MLGEVEQGWRGVDVGGVDVGVRVWSGLVVGMGMGIPDALGGDFEHSLAETFRVERETDRGRSREGGVWRRDDEVVDDDDMSGRDKEEAVLGVDAADEATDVAGELEGLVEEREEGGLEGAVEAGELGGGVAGEAGEGEGGEGVFEGKDGRGGGGGGRCGGRGGRRGRRRGGRRGEDGDGTNSDGSAWGDGRERRRDERGEWRDERISGWIRGRKGV